VTPGLLRGPLLTGQTEASRRHVQRVPEVVGHQAREAIEPGVLALELGLGAALPQLVAGPLRHQLHEDALAPGKCLFSRLLGREAKRAVELPLHDDLRPNVRPEFKRLMRRVAGPALGDGVLHDQRAVFLNRVPAVRPGQRAALPRLKKWMGARGENDLLRLVHNARQKAVRKPQVLPPQVDEAPCLLLEACLPIGRDAVHRPQRLPLVF